jgi:hypothetical protein
MTDIAQTTAPAELASVAELIDLYDSLDKTKRWAFRGQPQAFGTLVPSFQRQFSRRSLGAAEIIERRLIHAFREHYAELKDRSHDMPRPEQIASGYDLRCLSVMQHYEIPTRLLDWTSNYWIALYFASASDPGVTAELWYYDRALFEVQRMIDPSLMAFIDASGAAPAEPHFLPLRSKELMAERALHSKELIVELDPQLTPRMRQQSAHHTVSTNVFSDHAPLLAMVEQDTGNIPDGDGPMLRRVIIDASCKAKALQFLAEHMNITASTIFPDVVGLGRFLRWQFESLRTMLL